MADFSMRRSRKMLSPAELPLLIQPGTIRPEWAEAAARKGFTLIARVRDRQHVALRCHTCGGLNAVRTNVLLGNDPHCHHCLETARIEAGKAAGLQYLCRDPEDHHYAIYRMSCGHEARRQIGFVGKMGRGEVTARCAACLLDREEAEASGFGWTRVSRDPAGNPSYRLYRHQACGHEQRIAVANMRWGQCDCAGCGQSWTAKPSYIYLLDIRHGASARHFLKMGYSAHPVKRHRHQLGLPKDATVEVLRVVAMPTGHDACAIEKAAHVDLGRIYPDSVVPPEAFADLMNVVSEIYRPAFLPELHRTLDTIEADLAAGTTIQKTAPEHRVIRATAPRDPEPASSMTRRTRPTEARRSPTAPGAGNAPPIIRRHWGITE